MRKILSTLVLPVFAFAAMFAGLPVASAANVINNVTGSDNTLGASNTLSANVTLLAPLVAGDSITITTRNQDGSPLAVSAGALLISGFAETAVASGTGAVTVTLVNPMPAATAFNITGGPALQVTNPAVAENITVIVTTSTGEIGAVTHAIAGADTVTVTALVESTLSMALSSNTINLGVIDMTAVVDSIADRGQQTDVTVATNAANGYVLNAEAGAYNGTDPYRLVAFADQYLDMTPGNEGFAIRVAATPATILTGAGNIGAGLTTDSPITPVVAQGLVSGASTNGDTTTVEYGASISSTTPQGAYTETVTYSVTASF